ncbi:adenosine deaminase family protein [Granulicella sibirica]|nr:adenosine deaminase [Granulicella sibirica]
MARVVRLVLLAGVMAPGTSGWAAGPVHAKSAETAGEFKASKAFDIAHQTALTMHAFLERMPKGADLHMHLSGAIYAETFLRDGAADKLCVNPTTLAFVPNIGTTRDMPSQAVCAAPGVPASSVLKNQALYDSLVDSFSMRGYVPTPGITGHDQFFATFGRFGGMGKGHDGEWLDEVATRAAAQNEQYLEVMMTPSFSKSAKLGYQLGWPKGPIDGSTSGGDSAHMDTGDPSLDKRAAGAAELSGLREKLLAGGLRDEIATDREEIAKAFAERDRREHCGQPDAAPGCSVTIRVIYQVLRAFAPEQVFAQTVLGFEVASAEPRVVGINYVQPEDAYMAMSEYHRQMVWMDYLHGVYPKVHISLHAGELAPGMVPPEGLRFHIREAVDLGHAERIGHGVDVMYEERPEELLKEMAARHVMVEINLTSNDVILGVTSNYHSLPAYRAAGVPVSLSTDDEGVSRIDLTHEYTRAALDYKLSYIDLKNMARTGIAHTFLPGEDLWASPDVFTKVNGACAGAKSPGSEQLSTACTAFLRGSPKAAQEWELEHRFAVFEANLP